MTPKEKYESIDQSKLPKNIIPFLKRIVDKTDNFQDKEVVEKSKASEVLDKLISKYPEAVKKPKEVKKPTLTKKAKTVVEPTYTKKEIKTKTSALKTELTKLQKLINEDEVLKGFSHSTLEVDAKLKAKSRGKRVSQKGWKNQYGASKGGRKYYENRENRSDRYAPKFPKEKPFLANGGELMDLTQDMQQLGETNADFLIMADGGEIDGFTMQIVKGREADMSEVYTKNQKISYKDGGEISELMQDSIVNFDIPYAKGGAIGDNLLGLVKGGKTRNLSRDQKFLNHSESWEEAYSKGKDHRKGYMAKGGQTDLSSDNLDDITYAKGGETSKFQKGDKVSCTPNNKNTKYNKVVVGTFQKYNKNNTIQVLLANGRKFNYNPLNCTKI